MPASSQSILSLTFTANAAINQFQAVSLSGGVAAAGNEILGFAATQAAIGEALKVDTHGTTVGVAGAAIVALQKLQVGAAGSVIPLASGSCIGVALNSANIGDQVEVLLTPKSVATFSTDSTGKATGIMGPDGLPFLDRSRDFIPAGNRLQFPRRQSALAAGFNLMNVRWHRSPPVDIDMLVAYWYAGYQDQSTGLQPIGNDLSVAAAVMYPTASAPGAAKAFKRNGSATITVGNGQWVQSDPLSVYLPASTPWRLRSWVSPLTTGYIPYGVPCLGSSNGGSLSGFGGGVTDQSAYASAQADTTQASSNPGNNATNDTAFEPIVIGRPAAWVRSWALFGDSRTYGANEVGVSGGATASGAGDAWGAVGMWNRAATINGHAVINFGISGSQLSTWSTDGYSDFILHMGSQACNGAVIALGTNDTLSYTADQMLPMLQKMVNRCRALGFQKIIVPTLAPRTTGTFTSDAGQTIDATRSPRITTLNGYLRSGQLTGCTIIDQGAMCQSPTDPQKWRSDLGFLSTSDGTHEDPLMIAYCANLLAPLIAAA